MLAHSIDFSRKGQAVLAGLTVTVAGVGPNEGSAEMMPLAPPLMASASAGTSFGGQPNFLLYGLFLDCLRGPRVRKFEGDTYEKSDTE